MKKNALKCSSRTMLMIGFAISTNLYSAAPAQSNSAQQALEQLRIMQQRLSPSTNANASGSAKDKSKMLDDKSEQREGSNTSNTPSTPDTTNTSIKTAGDPGGQALSTSEHEAVDDLAFESVTQQLFPLNPEEIVRVKQLYQTTEYAQAATAGTPPKPTATSQFVNLSPGSTPPVIRLSQGFVSSLVFLDSTGAPWPISAYDLGNPAAFNIQWDKTSNTLMIQASKLYTYGNLAVRLRGLNTPVMLTLIPGQKAVDYRVDLRVQGYGPNAKSMPMEEGIPPAANDILLHVLDGVPPPGSARLTVSGGDAIAWFLNDRMFVRTSLTILSPGWIGSMTSADGTHAYEMQKSPVLLVSWHGKVMQLKVEGL